MSHSTENIGDTVLTIEERKLLADLLKHPAIKKMVEESRKNQEGK